MASTAWAGLLLAALASIVTEVGAGGGSGLLLVQGKLGSGTTDWDILIICVAIGRHVTDVCPCSEATIIDHGILLIINSHINYYYPQIQQISANFDF